MANGDDAAAAGWDLVAPTADVRLGYDEINKSRDYSARVQGATNTALAGKAPTTHTHTSAQISDATESIVPNTIVRRAASGTFLVPTPTSDTHAANKKYVDDNAGGSAQANGPTSTAYGRSATGSGWYQTWMNSSLQFMRNTSSRRYKKKIRPLERSLERVRALLPVTYEARDTSIPGTHIGLIAEDVAAVFPEVVVFDEKGRPDAINYEFLVAPLIGAVIELAGQLEAIKRELDDFYTSG